MQDPVDRRGGKKLVPGLPSDEGVEPGGWWRAVMASICGRCPRFFVGGLLLFAATSGSSFAQPPRIPNGPVPPGTVLEEFPGADHISLEEIFFQPEVPQFGITPLGHLPGVPRDFRNPDFLNPDDPAFDPGAPYASLDAFAVTEIPEPNGITVSGPYLSENEEYYFTVLSFRGPRMRSMIKGEEFPPPSADITEFAPVKEARLTAQLWLPGPKSERPLASQVEAFHDSGSPTAPFAVIANVLFGCFNPTDPTELGNGPDPEANPKSPDESARIGREFAKRGLLYVRWREGDQCLDTRVPPPPESLPLPEQFGFPGVNRFAVRSRDVLMSRGMSNLSVADLRLDSRYSIAQSFLLTGTFLQHYLTERLPDLVAGDGIALDRGDVEEWLSALRVIYSGGSKAGAAAVTAAGVDRRAISVDASGFQGYDAGEEGALRKHLTDWCEDPIGRDEGIRLANSNGSFVNAVFRTATLEPSYAKTYVPGSDPSPERYARLFLFDTMSTHDHNWPLGSSTAYFAARDGLDELGFPQVERAGFDVRHVRQPNLGHGQFLQPFPGANPKRLTSRFLLLFRGALHLAGLNESLPRMELVEESLPFDCDPNCLPGEECWFLRVRLDELAATHDPARETFRVHVLFSDDRDTRRFDGQGTCLGLPYGDFISESQDRASILHDTKPDEDFFVSVDTLEVIPEDVNQNQIDPAGLPASYRRLRFCPPKEILAFSSAPWIAVFVELWIDEDGDGEIGLGDLSIFTEVEFANSDSFPPTTDCALPAVLPPQIVDLCPRQTPPASLVVVYGENFRPETTVTLLDSLGIERPAGVTRLISRNTLRFVIPAGIPRKMDYQVCISNGGIPVCGPNVFVEEIVFDDDR